MIRKYGILLNPGHNRVYFMASLKLAQSELMVALNFCDKKCEKMEVVDIAGVAYLQFEVEEFTLEELNIIGKLSFVYAIFEMVAVDGENLLKPLSLLDAYYMRDDIGTILKYTGKTNELFTAMMINVAVLSLAKMPEKVKLLDPIAGKGTTLYEALIYGYDAYGVEIADSSVQDAYTFMRKYLETEKFKHITKVERVSGAGKSFTAKRHAIDLAPSKEAFKANPRHWELVLGDSKNMDTYFQKNTFDVIVGDLPYGVQHGNITARTKASITRNPSELIKACGGGWHKVLKVGGVMVLAWNNFVLPKAEFAEILTELGFEVLSDGVYGEFEHRVDNAIRRDIIVARKK